MIKSIYLRGGLGNQFFQYKYALYLRLITPHTPVILNTHFLNLHSSSLFSTLICDNFFTHTSLISPILKTLFMISRRFHQLHEPLSFHEVCKNSNHFTGYYQFPYPTHIDQHLLSHIRPLLHTHLSDIDPIKACVIHYRSGDYLDTVNNCNLGSLTSQYYFDALSKIPSDLPWTVVSNASEDDHRHFISRLRSINPNYVPQDHLLGPFCLSDQLSKDILSFLSASYLILANSSFSAALAQISVNSILTLYPYPWFANPEYQQLPISLSKLWTPVPSAFHV